MTVKTNLDKYVNSNKEVKARVRCKKIETGGGGSSWAVSFDQARWIAHED